MFVWLTLTVLLGLIAWIFQKTNDKFLGRPPGPYRFPGIGCLIQILFLDYKYPFVALHKLSKTYGNIAYVQIGHVQGVAINGYEALSEMYQNDDWIGRMDDKFILNRTFDKPLGLIGGRVDIWRETRRFSARALREFGFGANTTMDVTLQHELEELSAHLIHTTQETNGVLYVKNIFHTSILNLAWSLASGTHFTYDDPKLKTLVEKIEDFAKSGSLGASLLTSYPFLSDWAPTLVGYDIQMRVNKAIQDYLRDILAEIRAEGQYLKNPSSFIEVYLQKIDTREKDGTIDDIVYSEENLIGVLYDLLFAGMETSSNTLGFSILYMCLNPHVQEKVYNEITQLIGAQRPPALCDKEKMIYTQAAILEIFRMSTVGPMSPRRLYKDATIGKYRLRKGDTVFVNLWSASMDEEFWGDPHIFRPERFLDEATGTIVNSERILPFGAGKRNCIGESMARASIFILFVGLIQRFEFSLRPGDARPTMDPVLGFTLSPEPFTAIVTPRH